MSEVIEKAIHELGDRQRSMASDIKSQLTKLDQQQLEFAQRMVALEQGRGIDTAYAESRSIIHPVRHFLKDAAVKAFMGGQHSTGLVAVDAGIKTLTKALVSLQGGGPAGSYDGAPQRADGLYRDPRRALSLLDVLPTLPVTASAFEFVQLGAAFANAAGYQVNEGDAKPEQAVPTTMVVAPIKQLAVFIRASRQVLADTPALEAALGSLLQFGLLSKLEAELVAGAGTGGAMTGLVTAATAVTTTGTQVDRISQAAALLEGAGWRPGLVVMNPTDWHEIRTERGSTSEYVAGGWSQPDAPNVWGLPLVVTPSIAVNTALVLDPSQVAILDRESVTLNMSNSDATNFTTNQLTMLAELRAGLAVFAPTAISKVTLSP